MKKGPLGKKIRASKMAIKPTKMLRCKKKASQLELKMIKRISKKIVVSIVVCKAMKKCMIQPHSRCLKTMRKISKI